MGAPLGAEPAGDFAEDHARPQGTLAVIVGGGDIAAGDEDKEIAAAFADAAGEVLGGLGGGGGGVGAGTSRRVTKTKRSPRHLRMPRTSCWPAWVVGLMASSRSSLRSRSARYWARVVSLRSGRRRPMPTARCSSL